MKANKATHRLFLLVVLITLQLSFLHYLYTYLVHTVKHPNGKLQLVDVSSDDENNGHHLILQKIRSKLANKGSKSERCSLYFDTLLRQVNENFTAIDDNLLNLKYDAGLDILSNHEFFERENAKLKQELKSKNKDLKELDTKKILDHVNSQVTTNLKFRDSLVNSVSLLRWYSDCQLQFEDREKCTDLEARLFPWFTFEFPVFRRWDGTVVTKFPHIDMFQDNIELHLHEHSDHVDPCFWTNFHNNYNGKGLVVPVNNKHDIELLARLLRVLRLLKNRLPVEIVFNSLKFQPSEDELEFLVRSGRYVLTSDQLKINDHKQEVWFVDLLPLFDASFPQDLLNNSPVLLPTIFSSFEQAILITPDSVPLKKLDFLFSNTEYLDSGLFLFKSRQTNLKLVENNYSLVKSLFPGNLEQSLVEELRSLKVPENRYMNAKLPSTMTDPRVFVIDKSRKLDGLLTSLHLRMTTPIHDSELIWIGQSLRGSKFVHNSVQPAAIGADKEMSRTLKAEESVWILSGQAAHFIDSELVWMTDGFQVCDMQEVNMEQEFKILESDVHRPLLFDKVQNAEELEKKYVQMVSMERAVIPAEVKLADAVDLEQQAWISTGYCRNKIFKLNSVAVLKSKDSFGAETKDATREGKVVKFTSNQVHNFEQLRKAWANKFEMSHLDLVD